MPIKRDDSVDRRRMALIRRADTESGTTYNIGGVPRRQGERTKPSLPKMTWDEKGDKGKESE